MTPERSIEQKIVLLDDQGHSFAVIGDIQEKRYGRDSDDLLATHLSMGWKVRQMTAFGTSRIAVLLEKESKL
jgi:hypothetical protein